MPLQTQPQLPFRLTSPIASKLGAKVVDISFTLFHRVAKPRVSSRLAPVYAAKGSESGVRYQCAATGRTAAGGAAETMGGYRDVFAV